MTELVGKYNRGEMTLEQFNAQVKQINYIKPKPKARKPKYNKPIKLSPYSEGVNSKGLGVYYD